MGLQAKITQFRWLGVDWGLRVGPTIAGTVALLAYIVLRPVSRARAVRLLLRAHRMLRTSALDGRVKRELPFICASAPQLLPPACKEQEFLRRSIVLLEPSNSHGLRKGVLLMLFNTTFSFPLHRGLLRRVMDNFVVVLEPSWAGYADASILHFAGHPDPVFVQTADAGDERFLSSLHTNLIPVRLGSGCWVDHRVFRRLSGIEKDIDVIYVANSRYYKRMHVFMRMLRDIRRLRGCVRGALVCSAWGLDKREVVELACAYGIADDLELFSDLSQESLNAVLNRSRFSVLLSRKEGSNRTLFESMFANTPVALLSENVGVCREHIPGDAGLVVPEAKLAAELAQALNDEGRRFEPRAWAMTNISPQASTRLLAAEIRAALPSMSSALDELLVKVNAPELRYFDETRLPRAKLGELMGMSVAGDQA